MFYLDESWDDHHYFCAGILVDADQVAIIEQRLDAIAAELSSFFNKPRIDNPEFHGVAILQQKGDWARFDLDRLIDTVDGALSVIEEADVEVVAHGFDLPRFAEKYGTERDPHPWAFSNTLERVNERLKVYGERAIVIADEHSVKDRLRRDFEAAKRYGTSGYRRQTFTQLVDTVHFVDSRLSRAVQLADLVAYVRRRRAMGPERDRRAEAAMVRLYAHIEAGVQSGACNTIWWPQLPGT